MSRLDDLTVALEAAVSRHGHGTVAAHVHDVLAGLAAPETTLLEVERPVLGVDGCRDGWVGVLLRPDRPPSVHHASTIAALVEQVRENAAVAVVAIDIPLGLPDAGIRQADVLARRELAGKGSSVFTTLTRAAYQASSYADAREANLRHTGGTHSASAQAWALRAKILDADTWVQSGPPVAVIEVHPELAFARMAGAPLLAGKRTPEGVQVRRTALRAVGLSPPGWFTGSPFTEDDLLDACAAAWSGWRYSVGRAECLPDPPEAFDDGIPAAIRV